MPRECQRDPGFAAGRKKTGQAVSRLPCLQEYSEINDPFS
jgi:hypothetical protein